MFRITLLMCAAAATLFSQPLDEDNCPWALSQRDNFKKVPTLHKYGTTTVPVTGWFAYLKFKAPGIFWSNLSTWEEKAIPNTDFDVGDLQISDDGQWILYSYFTVADSGLGLIRRDGSGKVHKAIPGAPGDIVSWYRNSPFGTEVAYYKRSTSTITAVTVTLSSSAASFGTERSLVTNVGVKGEIAVNGNHVFLRGSGENHIMYTIPDNGRGTTDGNSNRFTTAPPRNCGLTLSPNGKMGLSNQGRIACLDPYNPGIGTGLHKGFLVIPFIEPDAAKGLPGNFAEFAFNHGVSLNPAPPEYKAGRFPAQEFHHWYWSNTEEWVVGIQQGSATLHKGVWLVNWKSSEWLMLTPEGNKIVAPQQPAVYIDPGIRLSTPHRLQRIHADSAVAFTAEIDRVTGVTSVEYLVDGAVVGTASAAPWTFRWSSHPVGKTVKVKAIAKKGSAEAASVEAPLVLLPRRDAPRPDSVVIYPKPFTIMSTLKTRVDVVAFDQYGHYLHLAPSVLAWNIPAKAGAIVPQDQTSVTSPAGIFTAGEVGSHSIGLIVNREGVTKSLSAPLVIKEFALNQWVRINMRSGSNGERWDPTPSPEGWIDDYGYIHALRESGYAYGFHSNFPEADIGRVSNPCPTVDGYPSIVSCTQLLFSSTEASIGDWEIQVPNARYLVKVLATKAARTDVAAWVLAEGLGLVTHAKYPGLEGVFADEGEVNVTDGFLTIKSGRRPAYPGLCSVELKRISDVVSSGAFRNRSAARNPAFSLKGQVLRVAPGSASRIEICDLRGRLLARLDCADGKAVTLPVGALGSSIVAVRITVNGSTRSQNFVLR